MATFAQNHIGRLLVSGGGVSYSDNTKIDGLNDGEVAAYSPEGLKIIEDGNVPGSNEINAGDVNKFMLVQSRGSNGPPVMSDLIDLRSVKETRIQTGSSATQQVDYIGYNGSSNSIDPQNDTLAFVRIQLGQHLTSAHGGVYVLHGQYNTDSSATQEEIALNLAKSLHYNKERETEELYRPGAINDVSVTGTNHLDEDLVITKGSNKVFISDAGTQNATTEYGGTGQGTDDGNAYVSAGDYIRIAGDGNSVSTTTHVYRVENVNYVSGTGATFTLDREIVEDDQTITGLVDGVGTEVIPSGSIGSNWGIRIEGVPQEYQVGKKPLDPINQVRWDLSIEGLGTTPITEDTTPSLGSGTYEEVADMEWFYQGNEGEVYRVGEPNIFSPRKEVTSSDAPYDLVHILHTHEGGEFQNAVSKKTTIWAVPNTTPDHADYGAGADRLSDVLEDLVGAGATVINNTVTSSETFSDIN